MSEGGSITLLPGQSPAEEFANDDAPQRARQYHRDNLDEKKDVIQETEGQAGQRSPEDKLPMQLDALKQYCSDEELDRFCAQAFQILGATGFGDARTFVVSSHDQLHARFKELEAQKITETE